MLRGKLESLLLLWDVYHKIKFINSFDEQVQPHGDKNVGGVDENESNESWEELPF